jgi:hypothetical protein
VGDIVEGGISVRHSAVGKHGTQVHSYLHRLVCDNGLLVRVCDERRSLRVRRLHSTGFSPEAQLRRIEIILRQAWNQLEAKLAGLRALVERSVNPRQMIEQLCLRQGFSNRIRDALIDALDHDETGLVPATEFDVVQAIARLTTHRQDVREPIRERLFALAGALSQRYVHTCPHCHSVLFARDRRRSPTVGSEPARSLSTCLGG